MQESREDTAHPFLADPKLSNPLHQDLKHWTSSEAFEALLSAFCQAEDPKTLRSIGVEASCTLAPAELRELYKTVEKNPLQVPIETFRKVVPMSGELARNDLPLPEFENISLSTHARLYLAKGFDGPRRMLVVFTGLTGQAQITYCRLLTRIPMGLDVLFVRRPTLMGYRAGIPGFGDDFVGSCERIRSEIVSSGYAGFGCLGTSAGGFWALRAAQLMHASIGVSMSGSLPNEGISVFDNDGGNRCGPVIHGRPPHSTRLYCIYGEDSPQDAHDANRFNEMSERAFLVPIKGYSGHNTMSYLVSIRRLKPFFHSLYHAMIDDSADVSEHFRRVRHAPCNSNPEPHVGTCRHEVTEGEDPYSSNSKPQVGMFPKWVQKFLSRFIEPVILKKPSN